MKIIDVNNTASLNERKDTERFSKQFKCTISTDIVEIVHRKKRDKINPHNVF